MKRDAEHAVAALQEQLDASNESPQDIIEAYLFTKRTLAESMQPLLREQIDAKSRAAFHDLCEELRRRLLQRYGQIIDHRYLKVPYKSIVHEDIFCVLLQRKGQSVEADLLRIITADSVHTERRTRELRELGLSIPAETAHGANVYTLESLDLDSDKQKSIVKNNINSDVGLSKSAKDALVALL